MTTVQPATRFQVRETINGVIWRAIVFPTHIEIYRNTPDDGEMISSPVYLVHWDPDKKMCEPDIGQDVADSEIEKALEILDEKLDDEFTRARSELLQYLYGMISYATVEVVTGTVHDDEDYPFNGWVNARLICDDGSEDGTVIPFGAYLYGHVLPVWASSDLFDRLQKHGYAIENYSTQELLSAGVHTSSLIRDAWKMLSDKDGRIGEEDLDEALKGAGADLLMALNPRSGGLTLDDTLCRFAAYRDAEDVFEDFWESRLQELVCREAETATVPDLLSMLRQLPDYQREGR